MKNKALKITLGIILICIGIAVISTCSYYLSTYSGSLSDYANQQKNEFWEMFGFIVGIILGIGSFSMGSLIIANLLYMYSSNKTLSKNKKLIKKGK